MPMGRQHRPLAAWIGDTELVPHSARLLREGAIDVEVQFGEPVRSTRRSDRKLVTRRDRGRGPAHDVDRAARRRAGPTPASAVNRLSFRREMV